MISGDEQVASKAGLPTHGCVRGVITLLQEDRFRVEDADGHGYLFTLGWEAGITVEDLSMFSEEKTPVTVEYQGSPDLGGVANRVYR